MTTITFDTLAFVKRLKAAGMPEPQAEAMSDVIKESQAASIADLATKTDIARLEGQITLLRWMLGFVLAGIVSIVFKLFFTP
jgi:hypothetical protein